MQFHLNGFHAGDPNVHPPAPGCGAAQGEMPRQLDVLIVGSGPAGLTLAAQLASFPEINTRIIERRDGPMKRGQADGISCRSMEMFNAFGFGSRLMEEAYWVNETTFWMPEKDGAEHIARAGRIQDVEDGLSEMPHVILNQARVHDYYLEFMRNSASRLQVDYNYRLLDLDVDPTADDYPVTVTLERIDSEGQALTETLRSRYVVGCDGAGSSVRGSIGRQLKGDYAFQSWGVMDVLAVTDFPDVRLKCVIKSASQGSMIIIPREGGYLVRIYVELDTLREKGASSDTTLEQVVEAAQTILQPYSFEVKDIFWWSVYEIGHSLTDKFDDVPEAEVDKRLPHVFIAGDACHTHSAKAGQGMNVSMGDTFNLGWKLISVLTGKCSPELLHSYSAERHAVAQDLIDFDHEWSRFISAPPEDADDEDGMSDLQRKFMAGGRFTAGMRVTYQPSALIGAPAWQSLASGFEIGSRFHSAPVVRLGDAKRVHLGHVVKADTRWHLFAFADSGEPAEAQSGISRLCDFLANSAHSPLVRHTPEGQDSDSVISTYGVFQQAHRELDFEAMPDILKPSKGIHQIKDYEKMFCPDFRHGSDIFDMRGIDRDQGCIVIVRPDQHVAHVLPLDAREELSSFFAGFMAS